MTGKQTYVVWTEVERAAFDTKQVDIAERELRNEKLAERNREIYARKLAGETYLALGSHYGISPARVRQICMLLANRDSKSEGIR